MKKQKKRLNRKILLFIIVSLLIVCMLFVMFFMGSNDLQQNKLTTNLKEIGKDFYENFYYDQVGIDEEQRVAFLKRFETVGIKVSLDNLSRYKLQDSNDILKHFVNNKTNESCDKDNTQVIIYPTSPYDKTSYNLEVNLDCGFND